MCFYVFDFIAHCWATFSSHIMMNKDDDDDDDAVDLAVS